MPRAGVRPNKRPQNGPSRHPTCHLTYMRTNSVRNTRTTAWQRQGPRNHSGTPLFVKGALRQRRTSCSPVFARLPPISPPQNDGRISQNNFLRCPQSSPALSADLRGRKGPRTPSGGAGQRCGHGFCRGTCCVNPAAFLRKQLWPADDQPADGRSALVLPVHDPLPQPHVHRMQAVA